MQIHIKIGTQKKNNAEFYSQNKTSECVCGVYESWGWRVNKGKQNNNAFESDIFGNQ